MFQHTAARRRLDETLSITAELRPVSTHSRPKAAGFCVWLILPVVMVSTHSRPKAAGFMRRNQNNELQVSTHSRPKAAGYLMFCNRFFFVCFNTQPPEGGWMPFEHQSVIILKFQHTAARRRLEILLCRTHWSLMFQHTAARRRLEAFLSVDLAGDWFQHTAARRRLESVLYLHLLGATCFNTQPPEGGWLRHSSNFSRRFCFNTQPPEGGWFLVLCGR